MRRFRSSLAGASLFAMARGAQRPTPPLAGLVLAALFLVTGSAIFAVPLVLVVPAEGLAQARSPSGPPLVTGGLAALTLVAQFLPIAMMVWAWVALWERRPLWTLGLRRGGALRRYLEGAAAGALLFTLALALPAALGRVALEPGDPSQQGLAALGGALLMLLGRAAQGAAEEILSRGWLLQTVGAAGRPLAAVAASSAMFALFHALTPAVGPLPMLNLFLFGALACLVAIREGGLWAACGLHTAWSWTQGSLFGLAVSGQRSPGGALLNLRLDGPPLLTGAGFGPEGGLGTTVVLAAAVAALAVALLRRPPSAGAEPADDSAAS